MLNVGKIEEGFVLDHIKAGQSLSIYHLLQLDKMDCTVAIIKNAKSNKMGKKDILKVECNIDLLDMDVLAVIDRNITVNVIKDGEIAERGTHEELVGAGGVYTQLYETQFSKAAEKTQTDFSYSEGENSEEEK